MDSNLLKLFDTGIGADIYKTASETVKKYGMEELISQGVIVGLSGGADSVMLLYFLLEYRKNTGYFPITAVHINHLIRGDEAFRDEDFSRKLCERMEVEFICKRIDVPSMAKHSRKSIEEVARNVRYCEFQEIIRGRDDISNIAIAHNADDNLETVILNIFRGSGTKGASGIPPVRDNICRPFIDIKKSDIVKCLEDNNISYVFDSTNAEIDYKRNRVRHKIVPELYGICDDPITMVSRLSSNLRLDDEFIDSQSDEIIGDRTVLRSEFLLSLHKALCVRVLANMAKQKGVEISFVIIESLYQLLNKENFTYSLPGNYCFVCERGNCFIAEKVDNYDYHFDISANKTELCGYDSVFLISDEKIDTSLLNVYKISIQADLSSAIIVGSLYLRPRNDGDTIYYGGMRRKLKKLFNDAKIPQSLKKSIPILCDDKGAVWVPGFGVRDDGGTKSSGPYAALAIGLSRELSEIRMRSASEFR